jgi:hypothetical protein
MILHTVYWQFIYLHFQPSRSYKKVHNFGKRSNSIKRNPNAPAVKSNWLYKQVLESLYILCSSQNRRAWLNYFFIAIDSQNSPENCRTWADQMSDCSEDELVLVEVCSLHRLPQWVEERICVAGLWGDSHLHTHTHTILKLIQLLFFFIKLHTITHNDKSKKKFRQNITFT